MKIRLLPFSEATTIGSRPWRWWLAGALALLVTVVAAAPSLPPGVRNWDNQVKLLVARNLLAGRGMVLTEQPPDPGYVIPGRDGKSYTPYPPGAYLLQLATIARGSGGVAAEGFPELLLLGLTAWVLVAWGRRSGVALLPAAAGTMLACFGTALWPMMAHGYDNLVEVLGLALVLWAGAGPERRWTWLLAGLGVGAAFSTRLGAVTLAIPATVLILGQAPRSVLGTLRRGLAFAAGCAPGILLVLWFNQHRFGSPWIVNPTEGVLASALLLVPWFSEQHWMGMSGLVWSPGKGLPWYAPPLLGVVALAVPLFRRHRLVFLALSTYAAVVIVVLGRLSIWHSDWAWGPRYVAPLCLAAVPLGWQAGEWVARRGRPAAVAAGLAFAALVSVQAVPVVGYPVESYFSFTLRPLSEAGLLATSPITSPPLRADHELLYFRIETSPIVRLARIFPDLLADPMAGPSLRARMAWAGLVPLLALAYLWLLARMPEEEPPERPTSS